MSTCNDVGSLLARRRELCKGNESTIKATFVEVNILVTDLVPSEMACLASSPGRMRRTAVWISREEIVDFLEYDASSEVLALVIFIARVYIVRTRCLSSNTLEDIVDERVKNGHSLVRDARIRVDLLED